MVKEGLEFKSLNAILRLASKRPGAVAGVWECGGVGARWQGAGRGGEGGWEGHLSAGTWVVLTLTPFHLLDSDMHMEKTSLQKMETRVTIQHLAFGLTTRFVLMLAEHLFSQFSFFPSHGGGIPHLRTSRLPAGALTQKRLEGWRMRPAGMSAW